MNSRWRPIEPLDQTVVENLRGDLAVLDRLHLSWREFAASLDESYQLSLRRRTLRRHAIETGILERLYDIEWGITETLVAEGLTRETIARFPGDLSQGVVDMIEAQLEGLNLVTEYVQQDHPLTTSFIKELHALITRAQTTYDATDALGRRVRATLNHGRYKTLPNNVRRGDGTLLKFAPPEQVNGEVERLVEWYNGMSDVHPILSAAWLHHRFVQIHPFQDGNGRVARALAAASLEQHQYPPPVVNRHHRDSYLEALDGANDGDLAPLARLFVDVAKRSVRRELSESATARSTREVAGALALGLKQQEESTRYISASGRAGSPRTRARVTVVTPDPKEVAIQLRAGQLYKQIQAWLSEYKADLLKIFSEQGLEVEIRTEGATPREATERWRRHILRSAGRAEHVPILPSGSWWVSLVATLDHCQLRFVASIHHVGSVRTGVMAITSFGDIRMPTQNRTTFEDTFVDTSWDAFTFSHEEDVKNRTDVLYEWLDQSLAVALRELMKHTLGG